MVGLVEEHDHIIHFDVFIVLVELKVQVLSTLREINSSHHVPAYSKLKKFQRRFLLPFFDHVFVMSCLSSSPAKICMDDDGKLGTTAEGKCGGFQ